MVYLSFVVMGNRLGGVYLDFAGEAPFTTEGDALHFLQTTVHASGCMSSDDWFPIETCPFGIFAGNIVVNWFKTVAHENGVVFACLVKG